MQKNQKSMGHLHAVHTSRLARPLCLVFKRRGRRLTPPFPFRHYAHGHGHARVV